MIESVLEGYLLHFGRSRLLDTADEDLRLLAGDYMYALGLSRLARLGDLDAVRALADLITLSARHHAAASADGCRAADAACGCSPRWPWARGPWPATSSDRGAREGSRTAELLAEVSRRATETGIELEAQHALIAFRDVATVRATHLVTAATFLSRWLIARRQNAAPAPGRTVRLHRATARPTARRRCRRRRWPATSRARPSRGGPCSRAARWRPAASRLPRSCCRRSGSRWGPCSTRSTSSGRTSGRRATSRADNYTPDHVHAQHRPRARRARRPPTSARAIRASTSGADEFIAISTRCAHLGCPVRWVEPCAAVRVPVPRRRLQRAWARSRAARRCARSTASRPACRTARSSSARATASTRELEAFSARDPGEPLDGLWQYLYPKRFSVPSALMIQMAIRIPKPPLPGRRKPPPPQERTNGEVTVKDQAAEAGAGIVGWVDERTGVAPVREGLPVPQGARRGPTGSTRSARRRCSRSCRRR